MPISAIVVLAIVISVVLFAALHSTAVVESLNVKLGGAAAGFFLAFWGLRSWYNQLEKRQTRSLELASVVARLAATVMVRDANRSKDQLTQLYPGSLGNLKGLFRKQGQEWLDELEAEFKEELEQQVLTIPELHGWSVTRWDKSGFPNR